LGVVYSYQFASSGPIKMLQKS